MTVDELLQSLREQPRPKLGPFFTTRIRPTARARVPLIVRIYWLLFACFIAYLVPLTPAFVVLAILVAAVAAFPEPLLLLGAMLLRE